MGVKALWSLLREEGVVEELETIDLLMRLEGKVLAVDLPSWMVASHTLRNFTHDHTHIKTVFDRITNM